MKIYWYQSPSAPDHAALTVCRMWFDRLNPSERDLVLRHVCTPIPVPLDQLARDNATLRHVMRSYRNQLPGSLDAALSADASALSAVTAAEKELEVPTEWREVLTRHPWLGVAVSDRHSITALQLLLGLRWRDTSHDAWLFDGDIDHCIAATLDALALEPLEIMTLETARRRLQDASVSAPYDEPLLQRWLTYCGITCQLTARGWTIYGASPTDANITEHVHRCVVSQIENETPQTNQPFSQALLRIAVLLHETPWDTTCVTLGDVLEGAGHLQGELGWLARSVRDAVPDASGAWALSSGTPHAPPLTGGLSAPARPTPIPAHNAINCRQNDDAQERSAWLSRLAAGMQQLSTTAPHHDPPLPRDTARATWLRQLRHDVRAVLLATRTPLSAREIAERLGHRVKLRTLREELNQDPDVTATGQDRWTLVARPASASDLAPTTAAQPARHINRQLDTVADVLTRANQPLSTAELKEHARLGIQLPYFKQKLDADPRFQRSAKDMWALSVWELPVYKPMKELVGDLVDKHGGAIDAGEVIRCLVRNFGIKESSLRQVMSSPPFTARGGMVRRLADVEAEQAQVARTSNSQDDDAPTADDLIKGMGLI